MTDRRPSHSTNGLLEFLESSEQQAFYRILDANANRAGEGLRTLEEWARFFSNDADLTAALKALRHDLTKTLTRLPRWALLDARNTPDDVGTRITTKSERARTGMEQIVAAASSRVLQSLRCLEEYGKAVDPEVSTQVETIRYQAYTLLAAVEKAAINEQQAGPGRWRREQLSHSQIYVLVDGAASEEVFARRLRALAEASIDVVQLRDARLSDREKFERAVVARRVLNQRKDGAAKTLFIVNDRPDIAAAADADGVHVGQDELPLDQVRRLVGPHRLIGWSTHDLDQVRQAEHLGADYIGCGPVFPGATKQFEHYPGPEFLRAAAGYLTTASPRRSSPVGPLPAFAIGGISEANVAQVQAAGFQRIAVTAALQGEHDLVARVSKLRSMLGPCPGGQLNDLFTTEDDAS